MLKNENDTNIDKKLEEISMEMGLKLWSYYVYIIDEYFKKIIFLNIDSTDMSDKIKNMNWSIVNIFIFEFLTRESMFEYNIFTENCNKMINSIKYISEQFDEQKFNEIFEETRSKCNKIFNEKLNEIYENNARKGD
jgi:hypothetical protein